MEQAEHTTERRSEFMAWLRRRFRIFGGVAGAVSHADTGPYAGAPRDPDLRVGDEKAYSTVRYTTQEVAYTAIGTDPDECRRCRRPLVELHRLEYVRGATRVPVGAVRTCRGCQADSWLLRSRMPAVSRARDTARKHVI
ncbi:hypothetical protein OHA72_29900 [Dactylosporangium sp. NBC_01737]|uniref:hypothetical protein n=1 Tax=Dactylosporangium sp. NBC_01737 TaxID=2975959 RepID=UPI002E14C3DB|nr:hypothetical protein OHA72_29900 [Dactylosporangium sp. NBC_01737]